MTARAGRKQRNAGRAYAGRVEERPIGVDEKEANVRNERSGANHGGVLTAMSSGHRSDGPTLFAACAVLILVAVLGQHGAIAQGIGDGEASDTGAALAKQQFADDIDDPFPAWEGFVAFAGDPEPNAACDTACQRDKADLQAQKSMADAAWAMVGVSIVGLLTSVFSLFLIWRTLYWSKRSFREAESSSRGTWQALEVTKEVGVNQVRAYLGISSMEVTTHAGVSAGDPKKLFIAISVQNGGSTPARNVEAVVAVYRRVGIAEQKLVRHGGYETKDIMPNADTRIFAENIEVTPAEAALLATNKETAFVVKGRVKYSTVVQTKRRTVDFHYHIVGDPKSSNPRLQRAKSGNSSD